MQGCRKGSLLAVCAAMMLPPACAVMMLMPACAVMMLLPACAGRMKAVEHPVVRHVMLKPVHSVVCGVMRVVVPAMMPAGASTLAAAAAPHFCCPSTVFV